ncbi:MAG TPA: DUF488 domain-containing protein [Oculatellaceae cyanobacterium]
MAKQSLSIKLKRAYEPPSPSDGKRILVERLWPRGISKEAAALDLWMKEISPSTELRKWYNHQPERWEDFQEKYRAELSSKPDLVQELLHTCQQGPVTFVFAAHDEKRNSAVVLKDFLENHQS